MKEFKNEILSILLIIVLGLGSLYAAYNFYGPRAVRMTLAGIGLIVFLVIKDIMDKIRGRKEREARENGGKVVMSVTNEKDKRVHIGNIAHRSVKDRDLAKKAGAQEDKGDAAAGADAGQSEN